MVDYKNTLTNHDTMVCLGAFIELLEKYEDALLEVAAGNMSENTRQMAVAALNFGNELIDGSPD